MRRHFPFLALLALVLAGCATAATNISSAWKDPSFSGRPPKSLMVVAVMGDLIQRRVYEDALVEQLKAKGVKAVASYHEFPGVIDQVAMTASAQKQGIEGTLLVTLLCDRDVNKYYPPSTTYSGPARPVQNDWTAYYFAYGQSAVTSPDYTQKQQVVHLRTNLYRTGARSPFWTAVSETSAVAESTRMAQSFAKGVLKRMEKEKLY